MFINSATATDIATDSLETYDDQLGMTADQIDRLRDSRLVMPNFNLPSMPSFGGSGLSKAQTAAEAARKAAEEDARRRAEEAARAAEEARRIEEERLRKRSDAFKSFADAVASTFGRIKDSILSSFNLPTLGNSVNSITRNIAKLFEKTKTFAKNITELSGLGLNSALLQQVIQAGPIAGSQLASAIVGGGSAFISQLNSAYGEFGNLASGIAGVGTDRAFANQEVINNYYQIEVSGGVGSGPSIGKAIVDAIKSYERTSGAVWQGA
jgi:vacuolar-type H+-ATPase subunit E/Vma4